MGAEWQARFARDRDKLDSANERFLRVTGMTDLLSTVRRETAIPSLKSLHLPCTLRETNRGICTRDVSHT